MSFIWNISAVRSSTPLTDGQLSARVPHGPAAHEANEDSVELSNLARTLDGVTDASSMRLAQVRAIRFEIENGTYETPERIQGTVRRLLDILA